MYIHMQDAACMKSQRQTHVLETIEERKKHVSNKAEMK